MIPVILSTLLGVSTGATVTAFLSSKSGVERRQTIKNEIKEVNQDIQAVNHSIEEVKHSLAQLMVTVQTLVPETKEEIETLTQQAKFQLNPRIDRVNQAVAQLQEDLNPQQSKER